MLLGLVYFSTNFSVTNRAELNGNLYLVYFVLARWIQSLTNDFAWVFEV